MRQRKKFQIKRLNGYSWSVIIAFICTTFTMQHRVANISFTNFFQALPLVIAVVYWCQKSGRFTNQSENSLRKAALFKHDLFLLSFSFFLASLISLVFSYDNSDAKGWWVLIIYLYALYGLTFSLIFSVVALSIKNHKTYTIIFACLIIGLISFGKFFPHYIPLPLLGNIDTFFVIVASLLIVHCLLAIGYNITKLFLNIEANSDSP